MRRIAIFISLLLFNVHLFGQLLHPAPGYVFDDSLVPKVEVTIAQEYLDIILAEGNEQSDEEFPADVIFRRGQDFELLEGVGFRIRGNTSRTSAKKSFKISVNAFVKGLDYHGLEKLNINGEHNDPSIIRSKLGWDLMHEAGALASRSNHVELYLNGEYKGLYINVEHIDEEYIEERFIDKSGNLYKCLWPADLAYISENPDDYKFESGGRRVYDLKRNEDLDDYSKLSAFISILNDPERPEFIRDLEMVFDVESFLRALAVEVLIAHWDNYSINKNNFYLYENTVDNKIYYIPYDLDNTLGIDWFDEDWAEFNIYEWYFSEQNRPLVQNIMAVDKYRNRFTVIVKDLLDNHFNPEILFPKIDAMKAMIQTSAENDLYRTYDWGFTIDDFNTSFTSSLDNFHVRYGLKEYISRRYTTALEQLDIILGLEEFASTTRVYPNPSNEFFVLDMKFLSAQQKFLSIADLNGRIIYSIQTSESVFQWNIRDSQVEPGVYLLTIMQENGSSESQRLVVLH